MEGEGAGVRIRSGHRTGDAADLLAVSAIEDERDPRGGAAAPCDEGAHFLLVGLGAEEDAQGGGAEVLAAESKVLEE